MIQRSSSPLVCCTASVAAALQGMPARGRRRTPGGCRVEEHTHALHRQAFRDSFSIIPAHALCFGDNLLRLVIDGGLGVLVGKSLVLFDLTELPRLPPEERFLSTCGLVLLRRWHLSLPRFSRRCISLWLME